MAGLTLVMAYEQLYGRGLKGGGRLQRLLRRLARPAPLAPAAALPRYVRLNRLRLRAPEAAAGRLQRALEKRRRREVDQGKRLGEEVAQVKADELLPELLVLHPTARPWLQQLEEVAKGGLVLQDRSSCLSALCASLHPGATVLDACAAPGSKTSHAVELLQGSGRLYAFERDPTRAQALLQRLALLPPGFATKT